MRIAYGMVAMCLLAGCFGDDEVVPGAADAGVPPDAQVPTGFPFEDPGAFDLSGCRTSPSFDTVESIGIFHLDTVFEEFGAFAGTMRVDPLDSGLTAVLFGRTFETVQHSSTELFLRKEQVNEAGERRIRALLLCAVADDGALQGQYASCRDEDCSLATVDAYRVEPIDEPVSKNVTLISEFNGPAATPWPADSITLNVRHRGTTAYIVRGNDGMRIVDLADPAAPVELGHSPVELADNEIYNDVKMIDGTDGKPYAIVGSNLRGAVAIDVSDPANPTEVSSFPDVLNNGFGDINVHTLFIDGTRAYLANTTRGGIEIFDVADPPNPVRLGGFVDTRVDTIGGFVHDLYVDNGRVYLNYWNLGMIVVDALADPSSPAGVGTFDTYERRTSHSSWATVAGGRDIVVHGDEDFGAHVRIVDNDEQSADYMKEIGSFGTRPWVSVHNIMTVGDIALVTYYQDGLRVLDLSDPTNPREIGHYQTWPGAVPGYGTGFYEGAIGVDYDVSRDLVYTVDTHRGLFVFQLVR